MMNAEPTVVTGPDRVMAGWRVACVMVLACTASLSCSKKDTGPREVEEPVAVVRKTIEQTINATGTIQPQNRLEVKPTTGGRMDSVLVEEGQTVTTGEVLCWMSSTERAALIDAARSRGAEALEYWEKVYKPSPILAPIDGTVILRGVEPGQSVNAGATVIVLSNRLSCKARVDETDIGRIRVGASAVIRFDAYPDLSASGRVERISSESRLVSNVTIYEIDIVPESLPPEIRAGMNSTVSILIEQREHALVVPRQAVRREGKVATVLVRDARGRSEPRTIETGMTVGMDTEVISGLQEGDTVLVHRQVFSGDLIQKPESNPFLPSRQRGQQGNRTGGSAPRGGRGP